MRDTIKSLTIKSVDDREKAIIKIDSHLNSLIISRPSSYTLPETTGLADSDATTLILERIELRIEIEILNGT